MGKVLVMTQDAKQYIIDEDNKLISGDGIDGSIPYEYGTYLSGGKIQLQLPNRQLWQSEASITHAYAVSKDYDEPTYVNAQEQKDKYTIFISDSGSRYDVNETEKNISSARFKDIPELSSMMKDGKMPYFDKDEKYITTEKGQNKKVFQFALPNNKTLATNNVHTQIHTLKTSNELNTQYISCTDRNDAEYKIDILNKTINGQKYDNCHIDQNSGISAIMTDGNILKVTGGLELSNYEPELEQDDLWDDLDQTPVLE